MKNRISRDIQLAIKNKNTERLSTLRMILADFQRKEKEKGTDLTEETALQTLQSMVRRGRDAIEQFRKGGREDLAEKEERELAVIAEYLPAQLSEEDLRREARTVISDCGASGPREMGKVMGVLTKKLAGRAEGSAISRIVKEELKKACG